MKKITIMALCISSLVSATSLSHDEITNMISKIKEERVGISLSKLQHTENPFIINKPKEVVKHTKKAVQKTPQEVVYNLHAILNHAAFINSKWYKKGDKLGIYKIVYIGKKSVELRSDSGNKTLSIKKRKNKFMKLNKGKK
jgi:hypothetical protein